MTTKSAVKFESELLKIIRAQRRTMRLRGMIPDWSNFKASRAGWMIHRDLNGAELRKYRATWELIHEVEEEADEQPPILLAMCYLVAEVAARRYVDKRPLAVMPAQFQISPERAARIKEAVLKRFADLTPNI